MLSSGRLPGSGRLSRTGSATQMMLMATVSWSPLTSTRYAETVPTACGACMRQRTTLESASTACTGTCLNSYFSSNARCWWLHLGTCIGKRGCTDRMVEAILWRQPTWLSLALIVTGCTWIHYKQRTVGRIGGPCVAYSVSIHGAEQRYKAYDTQIACKYVCACAHSHIAVRVAIG